MSCGSPSAPETATAPKASSTHDPVATPPRVRANPPVVPPYAEFDLGASVVAVSRMAEHIVVRDNPTLKIVSHRGEQIATSKPLVAEPDKPWARYGISPDGTLLAEADEERLRVVALPQGDVLWTKDVREIGTLWGPLEFSPDSKRLALPLQGHVAILDARGADLVVDIGSSDNFVGDPKWGVRYTPADGITLARRIDFSGDQERVAVICTSNTPSPSNHTVFVAAVESGDIVAELPGHTDSVYGVAFGQDHRVVTADGRGVLRWFDAEGSLLATLEAGPGFMGDVTVSPNERFVAVFHGTYGGGVWRRESARVTGLPRETSFAAVLNGSAWSLSSAGRMTKLAVEPGREAKIVRHSPETQRAQRAIWQIARGAYGAAVAGLDRAPADAKFAAARTYAAFKVDDAKDLAAFVRASDLGEAVRAGLAQLARDYVDGGFVTQALELVIAWTAVDQDTPRPTAERARMLAVAIDLANALDPASRVGFAEILVQAWPDDVGAVQAFTNAVSVDDPKLATKSVEAFIRRHPSSTEAWELLATLAWERDLARLDKVLARAQKALPTDDASTWAFVAKQHERAKRYARAVEAYDKAIALDPDESSYVIDRDWAAQKLMK
ncbi:MAG: hypothetical protein AAF721_14640 [Myxococcota bacterium]